jgi:predicted dehydrogenase
VATVSARRVGIIMNGVTGRMGRNQHLERSIAAIRAEGGLHIGGELVMPDPLLVGRDEGRLRALGEQFGISAITTDLDAALRDPDYPIYFDAQTTAGRERALSMAIEAGKDCYCEKPIATSSSLALALATQAERAGVRNGVVQDKLFLPGLLKLAQVLESGALGEVLSASIDFGYWVFPDRIGAVQRPSWNYRAEDGGGIILDMFCHFRYLLDHLFGEVSAVTATAGTKIPVRVDEQLRPYQATADDDAAALVELRNGAIVTIHASWCVRPYRDDLFVLKVDGSKASAVADLRRCQLQPAEATPRFTWNPDLPQELDPRSAWIDVPAREPVQNAFRYQWERFLAHVVAGEPFPWSLRDGARGVQFAELATESMAERRWVEVPEL